MPRLIRYPLSAAKLSIDIQPFGFWLVPRVTYRRDLTEMAKKQGSAIWWARWAWFQISYSRWV